MAIGEDRIFLTAGTSEAYAHLFRLLCDPGDDVLVPSPSYPLFDFLARLGDVALRHYPLVEEDAFRIDREGLAAAISDRTRAVLLVSPGNPTGVFLKEDEREWLADLCRRRGLAIICDEVFSEFSFDEGAPGRVRTMAGESRVATFTLDGISKMLALPQMKLGWIAASGPEEDIAEALGRLEVIADTYLSVNTPVQVALPRLLAMREPARRRILFRLLSNRRALDDAFGAAHPARPLPTEGGWSAVLRVPATHTDEEWALAILEEEGVLVHPGFLFDFPAEGRLVVSLLPQESAFEEGIRRVAARLDRA